jgi:ATP-dependent Clp protease ATP-binding subunit ClpC
MTSNVGANLLNQNASVGFKLRRNAVDDEKELQGQHDEMIRKIMNELKNTFKPEFLNRIDATIVFKALTQSDVHQICDLLMARIKSQLVEQRMELEMTPAAKDYLVEKGSIPATALGPCVAPFRT